MKKLIILLAILWGCALHAQDKADIWSRISINAEMIHTAEHCYDYGPGFLSNHLNNWVGMELTYNLGRAWTVGLVFGYNNTHRYIESWNQMQNSLIGGTASHIQMERYHMFGFGLEGTLHPLSFVSSLQTPYDLTVHARLYRSPQDLNAALGLGLSYHIWKNLSVYGRVYCGNIGAPYGIQESENGYLLHYTTFVGVSCKL